MYEAILKLICLLSLLISNYSFAFSVSSAAIVDTKPGGLILSTIPSKASNLVIVPIGFFKKSIAAIKENCSNNHNSEYGVSESKFQFNRDYEFIFFYSNSCQYCKSFAPVLKKYSNNFGIKVRSFVLGEKYSTNANLASSYLSNNNVANQESNIADHEIVEQFFERTTNASVPALFVVNKNNLHVYPVSQGALTYLELVSRMNKLKPQILQYERSLIIDIKSGKEMDRDENA
ncbi:exported hypothetical protein [Gammaproteobacteria bacterium]